MSRTKRKHPPALYVGRSPERVENHFGDQRKMRAKTKVNIRRRDRKRLGKPDEESSTLDHSPSRSRLCSIK